MSDSRANALTSYRRRMKRRGMVRVEVQVRKDDAPLIRGMASALSDPRRESETRVLLREHFARPIRDLKSLLADAPLEGVEIDRDRRSGRDVDL